MTAFDEWVAQTIFSISGIWPKHPCGLQRKRPLTFAERRMPACQWVCDDYFDPVDLGNMRVSARVLANFRLARKKQH